MSTISELESVATFIGDIETAGIAGDVVSLVKLIAGYIEGNNGTVTAAQLAVLKGYDGTKSAADYLAIAQAATPPANATPAPVAGTPAA